MPEAPLLLAIESSCDETSAAIIDGSARILAEATHSQIPDHRPYGGVVPELASRNHTTALPGILDRVFAASGLRPADLDGFAATAGPGLASSLLVGSTTTKALALATGKPFYAINHLEGHLLSPFHGPDPIPAAVVLIASGGHTLLLHREENGSISLLGRSRDDAAGEAFDKVGKMLGLPYPGGPEIDKHAVHGNAAAFDFPRAMLDSGDGDFSFSGLKTSVRVRLAEMDAARRATSLDDLCASFQEAVVDVLVSKSIAATKALGLRHLGVGGGVACNRRLRAALTEACHREGIEPHLVSAALATDNAAMIAFAALQRHRAGLFTPLDTDIDPNLPLEGLAAARGRAATGA
ncbi:MAG: tRNA (adenosine(37)-N6)-threonylcarbamoyltransferase complex transferase subunit TsaD [Verrucomicrobiales bacterium]